ncbi:MAG TPA: TIGR01459 family HAD-type hydrolase [Hyphomicrobiaceae bacterium]|jgi:HAD superfamily hydrolase (TIGR01459 family)|nr:TIGR01459 family HAD-type hydrolase [Hyphomicrobiaceae bacterium]
MTPPPILANAGPLLSRYDTVFCDVWGVVHNGRRAYAEAGEALARFRTGGGTVVLVSNAPVPADGVERVLEHTQVRRDAWDAIVSSGDIALAHIAEQGYRRLHRIGPANRDSRLFQRLPGEPALLREADAIVCTGLVDDAHETVEHYRALIEEGVARALPFVCANPDLVVDVGERRFLCAGSIAAEYERHGGAVFWAGKPHPSAYAAALRCAADLRGAEPPRRRILSIGDALRTDLAAAQGMGVDAVFIASGIHNGEVLIDGAIDPDRLAALFAPAAAPPAIAAMTELRW